MLGPSLEKISFFGHSMGGLIARIAVATEEFVPLRRFLHTFVSFCSPHLGATYRGNPLVRFGELNKNTNFTSIRSKVKLTVFQQ
jgi:alpha-beta hydrolase superfamily lysophospholipase